MAPKRPAAPLTLTLDNLGEVLRMSKALTARLYDIDPSLARSLIAKRNIESAMLPYIELQRQMRSEVSQTTITQFFSRRVPTPENAVPQDDPQPASTPHEAPQSASTPQDAPQPAGTPHEASEPDLSHLSDWSGFSDDE